MPQIFFIDFKKLPSTKEGGACTQVGIQVALVTVSNRDYGEE